MFRISIKACESLRCRPVFAVILSFPHFSTHSDLGSYLAHSSSLRLFPWWPEVIHSAFLLLQPFFYRLDEKRRFFNPGKVTAVLEHHQA